MSPGKPYSVFHKPSSQKKEKQKTVNKAKFHFHKTLVVVKAMWNVNRDMKEDLNNKLHTQKKNPEISD